jgi:hypothetical protein
VLSQNELTQSELDELIEVRHNIIGDFVDMFEKDNPRFDRQRFINACQVGANVKARSTNANGQLPLNQWGKANG